MSFTWYVTDQEQPFGPMSTKSLLRAIEEGRFTRSAKACRKEGANWISLAETEPFASRFPAESAPTENGHIATGNYRGPPRGFSAVRIEAARSRSQARQRSKRRFATALAMSKGLAVNVNVESERRLAGPEQRVWAGHPAFSYLLLMLGCSGVWVAGWYALLLRSEEVFDYIRQAASTLSLNPQVVAAIEEIRPAHVSAFFCVLLSYAIWRMVRCLCALMQNHYVITTQRIRVRTLGPWLSREFKQIELFRLKDMHVRQSLWGRLFNYSQLRLLSTDRLTGGLLIEALPGGLARVDQIRELSLQAKALQASVVVNE